MLSDLQRCTKLSLRLVHNPQVVGDTFRENRIFQLKCENFFDKIENVCYNKRILCVLFQRRNERIGAKRRTLLMSEKKKYGVMVLVLCAVLAFGLYLIVMRSNEPENPGASMMTAETETVFASETIASEDEETLASEEETEQTQPETEPETESETEPEETEPVVPANVSASGNMYTETNHVYVRVNHVQSVVLRLTGGLAQSNVVWTSSDENVADVTSGVVTGLSKGSCTITASCGDEKLEIPVTVREMTVEDGCTYVDGILVANKSYSLPEDYDPGTLPVTKEAFEMLAEDAAAEGLDIREGSAYRDYQFQVTVYNSMVRGYGKEYADAYSARPGHSEHQTGYTIDCNTIDDDFGNTAEGKWLAAHCHEYGFIIRYPRGKEDITGYAYESWHIRYVGVEHATAMYQQGLTLEEYLDIDSTYENDEDAE